MPHHVSRKHPHMSLYDRAAQFSPFAALTGHDAAVKETARLTEKRIELDENEKVLLNDKLQQLYSQVTASGQSVQTDGISVPAEEWAAAGIEDASPVAEITYFQPDLLKDGGEYVVKRGGIRKFDMYRRIIVMDDMTEINIEDIAALKIL